MSCVPYVVAEWFLQPIPGAGERRAPLLHPPPTSNRSTGRSRSTLRGGDYDRIAHQVLQQVLDATVPTMPPDGRIDRLCGEVGQRDQTSAGERRGRDSYCYWTA